MRKSTLIIMSLVLLSGPAIWAEEGLQDVGGTPAQAPQTPPLLLAQALPAMTPQAINPIQRLPGMSAPAARVNALPQPVITDLTNYPNPFDSRKSGMEGQTVIAYQLVNDSKVTVEMYDLLGHKVRGWNFAAGINGGRQGANSFNWDGTNEAGQKVSKGGYIAQLVIESPQGTVTVIRKIGVIH